MFKDWIQLLKQLIKNNYLVNNLICPECGEKSIDYVYVGDNQTNIGYLPIWCNSCNKGVRISRVIVPEGVKRIDILDISTIREKIPNYQEIYPNN